MAKLYQVQKEINGKKYTFQFNGVLAMVRALDDTYQDDREIRSTEKLSNYLLQNVVVEPKGLKIDDFDNSEDFNAVIKFAGEVMRGKHADEAIK